MSNEEVTEKSQFVFYDFQIKDMFNISTKMIIIALALSTFIIVLSDKLEIPTHYAGIIIITIGVPFGLSSLINTIIIYSNSSKFYNVSKLWFLISHLSLILTLLWYVLDIFFNIKIQAISTLILPILGIAFIILFISIVIFSGKWENEEKSKIIDTFLSISKNISFDTILLILSDNLHTLYANDLLFGTISWGGNRIPSRISGASKISIQEKDIERRIKKIAKNRWFLVILDNIDMIFNVNELINQYGGKNTGVLLLQSKTNIETLNELKNKLKIPIETIE